MVRKLSYNLPIYVTIAPHYIIKGVALNLLNKIIFTYDHFFFILFFFIKQPSQHMNKSKKIQKRTHPKTVRKTLTKMGKTKDTHTEKSVKKETKKKGDNNEKTEKVNVGQKRKASGPLKNTQRKKRPKISSIPKATQKELLDREVRSYIERSKGFGCTFSDDKTVKFTSNARRLIAAVAEQDVSLCMRMTHEISSAHNREGPKENLILKIFELNNPDMVLNAQMENGGTLPYKNLPGTKNQSYSRSKIAESKLNPKRIKKDKGDTEKKGKKKDKKKSQKPSGTGKRPVKKEPTATNDDEKEEIKKKKLKEKKKPKEEKKKPKEKKKLKEEKNKKEKRGDKGKNEKLISENANNDKGNDQNIDEGKEKKKKEKKKKEGNEDDKEDKEKKKKEQDTNLIDKEKKSSIEKKANGNESEIKDNKKEIDDGKSNVQGKDIKDKEKDKTKVSNSHSENDNKDKKEDEHRDKKTKNDKKDTNLDNIDTMSQDIMALSNLQDSQADIVSTNNNDNVSKTTNTNTKETPNKMDIDADGLKTQKLSATEKDKKNVKSVPTKNERLRYSADTSDDDDDIDMYNSNVIIDETDDINNRINNSPKRSHKKAMDLKILEDLGIGK